ncbi:transcriptional regulator [Sphingomonas psychrolutea]|uniref:Transcriptional regulator n=1 Tax=Sphingomonas psychrolutea TaxID=1259676 RepID=A0ABQ1H5P3_9SPHN|nr:transcriptional regulator [Sphingomonas psychrolutea]
MDGDSSLSPQRLRAECVCLNLARVSRALTRRYDAAFRSIGLTSGQFAILGGLNQPEPVRIGALADALGLERTTLTRNLAPLQAAGLIRTDIDDDDKRVRRLVLSDAGRDTLGQAVSLWQSAQDDSRRRLDGQDWASLRGVLDRLQPD